MALIGVFRTPQVSSARSHSFARISFMIMEVQIKMNQKTKLNGTQKAVSLELSAVKIEQINKQPIIESSLSVSEDGRWVIHRTIITDIKPVTYFEKVLDNIRE